MRIQKKPTKLHKHHHDSVEQLLFPPPPPINPPNKKEKAQPSTNYAHGTLEVIVEDLTKFSKKSDKDDSAKNDVSFRSALVS